LPRHRFARTVARLTFRANLPDSPKAGSLPGLSTIKSTFAIVEPERELTWTGIASGAKAVDRHTLEATDNGVRVFTEESMAGPFLTLFFSSQKLLTTQRAFLAALKRQVERTRD
jgi:hypothetical protein